MTNPSREKDHRAAGMQALDASAFTPPDTGRQAALQKYSSGTAGAGGKSTPRQFSTDEVLVLLVEAVRILEDAGKRPVAAGVAARMKTLDRDFSVRQTEFTTFREVLQAGVNRGLIELSGGTDDLVVTLRNTSPEPLSETLRHDLWRALHDWTDGARYAYRPSTQRTSLLSGELTEGDILVPTLTPEQQHEWMTKFASSVRGADKEKLEAAITDGTFQAAVRSVEPLKRRWGRYSRRRVLDTATQWAAANNIPEKDILTTTPKHTTTVEAPDAPAEDDVLRRRVLDTLASMPLHELLRLPIPLEYTLR